MPVAAVGQAGEAAVGKGQQRRIRPLGRARGIPVAGHRAYRLHQPADVRADHDFDTVPFWNFVGNRVDRRQMAAFGVGADGAELGRPLAHDVIQREHAPAGWHREEPGEGRGVHPVEPRRRSRSVEERTEDW